MVNKPKIQGTNFETKTVNLLKANGFKANRIAEGGINDEGDIECFTTNDRIILEAKHRANLNVHQTLHKAKGKSVVGKQKASKKAKAKPQGTAAAKATHGDGTGG